METFQQAPQRLFEEDTVENIAYLMVSIELSSKQIIAIKAVVIEDASTSNGIIL